MTTVLTLIGRAKAGSLYISAMPPSNMSSAEAAPMAELYFTTDSMTTSEPWWNLTVYSASEGW